MDFGFQGDDVFIDKNVNIREPQQCCLGSHIAIDFSFHCTTKMMLHDYVHIGPHVSIVGGKKEILSMGNFTTLSAGVRIICASDAFLGEGLVCPMIPDEYRDRIIRGGVILGSFVSVATNAVVFPGVNLATGSVIAANSFIKEDTEPWGIYGGTPAKKIGERKKDIMLEYAAKLGYHTLDRSHSRLTKNDIDVAHQCWRHINQTKINKGDQ